MLQTYKLYYICLDIYIYSIIYMLTIGGGRRMRFTTLIDGRGRYVWALLLTDNLLAYDCAEFCVALVAP